MKNWFKKQKYKFAIVLCSILSIFTLFLGINKTYAYETNQFSYTIDTTNETFTTIDNNTGILMTFGSYRDFTLLESTSVNQYLLVNAYIYNNGVNIQLNQINFGVAVYNQGRWTNLYQGNIRNTSYNDNYMYTFIIKLTMNNSNVNINVFNFEIYGLQNTYSMLIVNMDYVNNYDIGLQQYYETYYGQIEDNYNTLLNNYNDLQHNYDTLENNYNTLESNYNDLENNYNTLLQQKNALEEEIISKQNQINTLTNELNRLNSEFNNIINVSAPFNPNNIGVATVLFNNTLLDIPYNSFVIFDYFQIELDLFDFDLIDNYNYNSNHLTITLNLLEPKDFGTLKYWCNMRHSVGDYLSIYYYSDSTLLYSLEFMNNEHTDNNGDMAPYYLDSANNVNRVVFDFFLNDDYSSNNPYSNNTDYIIQYGTYSQGYNDGLNAANEYNDIIINNYQNEIQIDNAMIDNLHEEIHNLKQQINIKDGQIKLYQQARNDYNLNNMIWTIASTPFESFKQIWNVNFFGVNISTMITGFITGIIVLWIIKKFFL